MVTDWRHVPAYRYVKATRTLAIKSLSARSWAPEGGNGSHVFWGIVACTYLLVAVHLVVVP